MWLVGKRKDTDIEYTIRHKEGIAHRLQERGNPGILELLAIIELHKSTTSTTTAFCSLSIFETKIVKDHQFLETWRGPITEFPFLAK